MFPEGQRALGSAKHVGRALANVQQRESFAAVHAGLGAELARVRPAMIRAGHSRGRHALISASRTVPAMPSP